MSKHVSNKQPSPAEVVAAAERMLDALKAERVKLAERAAECAESMRRLAFGTHALHDPESSRELNTVRAESIDVDARLREHDVAISEAERRLAAARDAEARAADREAALALRRATRAFVEAGRAVDHALALLARHGHALIDVHSQLARHGTAFPSVAQLESLGHICLRTAIMNTPWARTVEHVAPGQRRSFASPVEGWAANIEQNSIKPRLGEQTNEAA
jgi:hypothetical protein